MATAPIAGNGVWTMYSTDSGTIAIHTVPLSNGEVLIWERPGNREEAVSLEELALVDQCSAHPGVLTSS